MKLLMKEFFNHPVFRRWLYVIFLSIMSIVIVFVLKNQTIEALIWWHKYSAPWHPLLKYTSICFLSFFIALALMRLGGVNHKFTLKTMLRYPPSWLAAFIALAQISIIVINNRHLEFDFIMDLSYNLIFPIEFILFGILLAFALDYFECPRCSQLIKSNIPSYSSNEKHRSFSSDDNLIGWILEERPIFYPYEDLFGHSISARKIAKFLMKKNPMSIGITGEYGSGKSSLINLVEYFLNNQAELFEHTNNRDSFYPGNIVCCRIGGWGRTYGSVAKKILSMSIEQVKCYADCMSVISLPEDYYNAVVGSKSWGGAILSALFQNTHDPVLQLSRLDDILTAAGLRLIIFLEDLDRNIGDEIIRDEMPALLDRLKALRQISFVLAIGIEHHYSGILIRICDHVEAIS